MKNFYPNRFEIARKFKKKSKKEISEITGLSRAFLSRLENGNYKHNLSSIKKIASALLLDDDFFYKPLALHVSELSFLCDFRFVNAKEKDYLVAIANLYLNDSYKKNNLKINLLYDKNAPFCCSFFYDDKYFIIANKKTTAFEISIQTSLLILETRDRNKATIFVCSKLLQNHTIEDLSIKSILELSKKVDIPISALLLYFKPRLCKAKYYYFRRWFKLNNFLE